MNLYFSLDLDTEKLTQLKESTFTQAIRECQDNGQTGTAGVKGSKVWFGDDTVLIKIPLDKFVV